MPILIRFFPENSFDKEIASFPIQSFQTIVFVFIVIFPMFWLICPPAFFRCLSNWGTYMDSIHRGHLL